MKILHVPTRPIEGQKPGTSGLRARTSLFMQPGYLENFIQSIFDATGGIQGNTLTLGGDGRFFNKRAIQTILRMASANGAERVFVGRDGILSTPAASAVIRHLQTDGGIILSASHNPGGENGDFGVKYNVSNGGPAPEDVTARIFEASKTVTSYAITDAQDVDLSTIGESRLGDTMIEVVDPVADYATMMAEIFDFDAIRTMLEGGFRVRFDAMHAVTGPYAKAIFEGALGAPAGSVVNADCGRCNEP